MAYRLTALSSSARSARSARSALLELDRVEVLRPRRVRHVAFHAFRERQGRLVVGDEEPPHVIMEHLLGLPVELGPLRLIREPLGAQEDVPQRLVRVEPLARTKRWGACSFAPRGSRITPRGRSAQTG